MGKDIQARVTTVQGFSNLNSQLIYKSGHPVKHDGQNIFKDSKCFEKTKNIINWI